MPLMSDTTRLSIYEEATVGTIGSNADFLAIRHTGSDLRAEADSDVSDEMSPGRTPAELTRIALHNRGGWSFRLCESTAFDRVMTGLFHNDYSVDILTAGDTAKTFTLERRFGPGGITDAHQAGNFYERLLGCYVETLQLQWTANSIVRGTFGIVGGTYADPSSTDPDTELPGLPTYGAFSPVVGSAPSMKAKDCTLSWLGGLASDVGCVTDMSLNFNNQSLITGCIGTEGDAHVTPGKLLVQGTGTVVFDDMGAATAFKDEEAFTLTATFSDGSSSHVFAGSGCKLTGAPIEVASGQAVVYQFAWDTLTPSWTRAT